MRYTSVAFVVSGPEARLVREVRRLNVLPLDVRFRDREGEVDVVVPIRRLKVFVDVCYQVLDASERREASRAWLDALYDDWFEWDRGGGTLRAGS